jgi:hypothetical protein
VQVGTARHQYGLEACTVGGTHGNKLENGKPARRLSVLNEIKKKVLM